MAKIEIYTTPWCGYCARAKALLEKKGAAYEETDVMEDRRQARRDARALQAHDVPQIFINGQHIGGSDELAALEQAGKLDALLAQPG
jgi:glutaredoxin 3